MHTSKCVTRWLAAAVAVLCLSAVWVGTAAGQVGGTIRGTVIGEGTLRPLELAIVRIVELDRETRTGPEGEYEFRNVAPGQYTIEVRTYGYHETLAQVTVATGQVAVQDFSLARAPIEMEAIIVTGTAGGVEKREIGNAVTFLSVEDLVPAAPIANVQELLNARAPGLTMYKNSGLSGTGSNVRIRGAGSLNAGYVPVYYIDGIRFEGTPVTAQGTTNSTVQNRSPLEFIDPADIERIEVIKGPAAATLYGADAAGGVIQIITKKGMQTDRVRWSTSFEYGGSSWQTETPATFYQCNASRIANTSGRYPGCEDPSSIVWEGPNGPVTGITESEILRDPSWGETFVITDNPLKRHPAGIRTGKSYDFKLSARGGAQLFNYYLSFNKMNEDGVFFNNFNRRTGGRANFEFTPSGTLNFGVNFGYTRNHLRLPLSDNASDGILRNAYRGRARAYDDSWEPGFHGFGPYESNEYDRQSREERTTIGLTASWDPFPWLENRVVLGLDKYDVRETTFFQIDSIGKWGSPEETGEVNHWLRNTHTWTFDYSGSARARLTDDFNSRFSAGVQLNARQYRRYSARGDGLVANSVNLVSSAANNYGGEAFNEQTSLGFYLQEQIGWRDRLFVTGAVRFDDNSAFGANFSMVAYPKFSLSYIISDEDWFNLPQTDELKLRFAWGQAGNAPPPFTADRTSDVDVVTVGDEATSALRPSEYGNPDLKAETGSEWETGFDASLFTGKVGLELTYYNQHTKDALMEIPDPPSSGFNGTHLVNIGEIANSGWEILLTSTPVLRRNFAWDLTFSFTSNKNELVSFGGTRDEVIFGAFADVQRHREGYPLGAMWANDVERDANGDPVIDGSGNANLQTSCTWPDTEDPDGYGGTCQERYVGSPYPTREFGLSNTFTIFGNLRIFANMDYKGGHYQYCAICEIRRRSNQNTWEVANPDADPVDLAVAETRETESTIMAADFLKIRELSFTYTIPGSWGGPFRDGRWNITVAARNLVTWTKYDGPGDPEVLWSRTTQDGGGPGNRFEVLDYASVPPPRRVSIAIQINY
jgi:TonB-linked SusC/RagA family outer membrane protein